MHYCVTNMPGIVPHTSTYALTNATLSYCAGDRRLGASRRPAEAARAAVRLNVLDGRITHPNVAAAIGAQATPPETLV